MDQIIQYIAYLSLKQLSYSSVSTRISALGFYHKIHNQFDNTKNFIVRKMLNGIRRSHKTKDPRAPITLHMLRQLPRALHCVCFSNYESTLFTSAFTLAFFGFLRVGEFAVSSSKSNITSVLKLDDISIHKSGFMQIKMIFQNRSVRQNCYTSN